MNYSELVKGLCKPGEDILSSLTPSKCHLLHMAVGVMGEAVEFYQGLLNNDLTNMVEELGDVHFYLQGISNEIGCRYELTDRVAEPVNGASYLITASGDLLDAVKKWVMYNNDEALDKVHKTFHAVRQALVACMAMIPISGAELQHKNIQKLSKRYKGGQYSDKGAKERADKQEPTPDKTAKISDRPYAHSPSDTVLALVLRSQMKLDESLSLLRFVSSRVSRENTMQEVQGVIEQFTPEIEDHDRNVLSSAMLSLLVQRQGGTMALDMREVLNMNGTSLKISIDGSLATLRVIGVNHE